MIYFSEYLLRQAEDICINRFENDIMLVFNNFSDDAILLITKEIKDDLRKMINLGVLMDLEIIKIFCSMYLGLAWSTYGKGKLLQKERNIVQRLFDKDNTINSCDIIFKMVKSNLDCVDVIDEIAIRYYTLYISKYTIDLFLRMNKTEIKIKNFGELQQLIINMLKNFGVKILSMGIYDEYLKECV